VLRVQPRVSDVVAPAPQAPPEHTIAVHERLCVPVVPQVEPKPPQAVHEEQLTMPQAVPSVGREQVRLSGVVAVLHAPATQEAVDTVRLCVPTVAHSLAKPPQADQLPGGGALQSPSTKHSTQAAAASSHMSPPHGSPAPTQEPPAHVSAPLQNAPSSQLAVLFTFSQPPAPHASSVHGLSSSQPGATQLPAQQTCAAEHALVRTQVSASHVAVEQPSSGVHVAGVQVGY